MCINQATIHKPNPSTIDGERLRTDYERALKAQAGLQKRILSPINRAVSDVVFNTAMRALEDTRGNINTGKFKVVSAPTGSSKTTSAIAFAFAGYSTMPDDFSCAFVVEEIRAAQEIYSQLLELLPPEVVGIWTSQHDAKRPPMDHQAGQPLFTLDQMREIPIVVFTHSKWIAEMERQADWGIRCHRGHPRDILFIDEQPKVINIYNKTHADVAKAGVDIARMEPDHPWVDVLTEVSARMQSLFRTDGSDLEEAELLHCLEAADFSEERAEAIWRGHYGYPATDEYLATFKFLKACTLGYSFFTRQKPREFVAYLPQFEPAANQVLLDATADVSELSLMMGGELAEGLPEIDYSNLTIHHLDHPKEFSKINRVVDNRGRSVEYAEWIHKAVMENTSDGDVILVVMHKAMFERHALFPHAPAEPNHDVFPNRKAYIIWWGQGIGSNTYKTATKVFMFSEFYMPRRTTVANTLGASGRQAKEGDLRSINRNLTGDYLTIQEGDLLRWTKQLACRGNVRNVGLDGKCGNMGLYTSMDFNRLIRNLDRLFPGAKAPTKVKPKAKANGEARGVANSGRDGLINLLSTTDAIQISSKEVEALTGISSRNLKVELAAPSVAPVAATYGWSIVPSKAIGKPGKGNWLVKQPQQ